MKNIKKMALPLIGIILLICVFLISAYLNRSDKYITDNFFSMDTAVSIALSDDFKADFRNSVNDLSDKFDRYNKDSEIYSLNQKHSSALSDDTAGLISETLELNDKFGYDVNILSGNLSELWKNALDNGTIPSDDDIKKAVDDIKSSKISASENNAVIDGNASVDFGAVAKGYALDKLYQLCEEKNLDYACISFGSSSLLYDARQKSSEYTVQIKNPSGDGAACSVQTKPCFFSTSGSYERFTEVDGKSYHHILDLETGYPSENNIVSVTIFCDSGIMSDFLSTLIFIDGEENLSEYLDSDEFSTVIITADNTIYSSKSLDITLEDGFSAGDLNEQTKVS